MTQNLILPGFNPDPSICRAGSDYYIATSTFEWYPGVQIHHSRDLENWELACRPLTRASQLDMRGNPDSCGVWAPCLSYCDDRFWLVYTDVKRYDGNFKDAHNYLVTAPAIEGPWSDPVYLNSSGFDPSLFHDDDGRKWLVNMVWNHRGPIAEHNIPSIHFWGIVLQEFNVAEGKLAGPVKRIFQGSPLGFTEGPHLFKRNGWYYLVVAEGGTGYGHAVTHARSRTIDGPYELHPEIHVITAKDSDDAALQRTGHGQVVETEDGEVFHTFLCSRPLPGTKRSPLGRESGIERLEWRDDGWLYKADGSQVVPTRIKGLDTFEEELPAKENESHYTFENDILHPDFQWLRTPHPERLFSLTAKPGWLRLFGRESIGSWFEQSLLARRATDFKYSIETKVSFEPQVFQQMAGLVAYYNRYQFHYLCLTADDDGKRVLTILSCPGNWPEGWMEFPVGLGVPLPDGDIWLAADIDHHELVFRYATGEGVWQKIGPTLDASALSDEAGRGVHANFTGAFVGMAAQDLSGRSCPADFLYFKYRSIPGESVSSDNEAKL